MARYRISYAQNREDIILSGFFGDAEEGFYVDVGANHPDTLSITKFFYDKGWRGINIEPNQQLYKLIEKNRPRDINLNVGAADKAGELTLREYPDGDGLSTFSKTAQQEYEKASSAYNRYTQSHKDYVVPVRTLKDIFDEYKPEKINFMNIDVEGFEYQVIKGNDWSRYRPQVLCIEANHIDKDWRPLLKSADYTPVFFDGLNDYYVAQEHDDLINNFSYVNTMLLGKPVIPAHLQQTLSFTETRLRNLEDKFTRQELIEAELRTEISNLYVERTANRRIKALIKRLIMAINAAILIQIEKLNHPKIKRQPPIRLDDKPAKQELLTRIKLYDLGQYYDSKSQPLLYTTVHAAYTAIYDSLKSSARWLVRRLGGRHA